MKPNITCWHTAIFWRKNLHIINSSWKNHNIIRNCTLYNKIFTFATNVFKNILKAGSFGYVYKWRKPHDQRLIQNSFEVRIGLPRWIWDVPKSKELPDCWHVEKEGTWTMSHWTMPANLAILSVDKILPFLYHDEIKQSIWARESSWQLLMTEKPVK